MKRNSTGVNGVVVFYLFHNLPPIFEVRFHKKLDGLNFKVGLSIMGTN
jgi:hypothetical protein